MGLRNAEYCILNKQYSKQEYEDLHPKVVEHMKKAGEFGEFFPMELSPFAYNESIAGEYLPLIKEEVISRGWRWKDEKPGVKYEGPQYEIPQSIEDVGDEVLEKILTCEKTGKNYRIVKQELDFYRRMKLPLPSTSPETRHEERMNLRNPRKLFDRECSKCGKGIETTFSLERSEKVLCEGCYLDLVH